MPIHDLLPELDHAEAVVNSTEFKTLIAERYPFMDGELRVKSLWTRGGVHYCRANWWRHRIARESYIASSVFLAVETLPDGLQVRELRGGTAVQDVEKN